MIGNLRVCPLGETLGTDETRGALHWYACADASVGVKMADSPNAKLLKYRKIRLLCLAKPAIGARREQHDERKRDQDWFAQIHDVDIRV